MTPRLRRVPNFVSYAAWCATHEKKGFGSRKDAKRAIRVLCERGMSEYRCDVNEALWHIGHMPGAVIQGKVSRSQIAARRSNNA